MIQVSLYILPFVLLYGVRKYIESKWGKCKNKIQLNGKTVVVTGANSGIGFEVTKELASRHANVVLACRNLKNAEDAIERILKKVNCKGILTPMELDLASLNSIANFVETFKKNHKDLHVLINNAGVSMPRSKREITQDGLEIHFGVNYLGHFHLTNLLLDVLEKSVPSRIVTVSSKLHEKGIIDLEDLNDVHNNSKNLYSNSKLANVYFCRELARRIEGKNVDVFAVCPGWIYTNLFRHSIKWYHYFLVAPIAFFFMRSPKQGAQTVIYCATEPGLQTGMIYRDCQMYESNHKFNDKVSLELWEKSSQIIKTKLSQ